MAGSLSSAKLIGPRGVWSAAGLRRESIDCCCCFKADHHFRMDSCAAEPVALVSQC